TLLSSARRLNVVVAPRRSWDTPGVCPDQLPSSLRSGRQATRANARKATPATGTHGRPGPVRGRAPGAVGVWAGLAVTTAGAPWTADSALASCRVTPP